MTSHPMKRLWDLSAPKPVHEDYKPERSCIWKVRRKGAKGVMSKRMLELSMPQFTR